MPHLNLEYSANVEQSIDYSALFAAVHRVLNEVGGVNLNNCKSRARKLDVFYLGDGSEKHALVHLEIALLEGRTPEVKSAVTAAVLELLRECYQPSLQTLDLQISVEMRDIERGPYAKFPGGTLTPM